MDSEREELAYQRWKADYLAEHGPILATLAATQQESADWPTIEEEPPDPRYAGVVACYEATPDGRVYRMPREQPRFQCQCGAWLVGRFDGFRFFPPVWHRQLFPEPVETLALRPWTVPAKPVQLVLFQEVA